MDKRKTAVLMNMWQHTLNMWSMDYQTLPGVSNMKFKKITRCLKFEIFGCSTTTRCFNFGMITKIILQICCAKFYEKLSRLIQIKGRWNLVNHIVLKTLKITVSKNTKQNIFKILLNCVFLVHLQTVLKPFSCLLQSSYPQINRQE